MDIHQSKKHGPFSRLYFFTAILIIVVLFAFIIRNIDIFSSFEKSVDTNTQEGNVKSVDETDSINVLEEIKTLNSTSGDIENKLISAKDKDWSSGKQTYSEIIEKFKSQYPIIANLINIAKNNQTNTSEVEKSFDDLKQNIDDGQKDYLSANKIELQKKLDLSLTNYNSLIALISNL